MTAWVSLALVLTALAVAAVGIGYVVGLIVEEFT